MLETAGIRTAWEFTQQPAAWVRKRMSVVGLRMWQELHGEPCIGFEQPPADKKQIATTRTFDRDTDDFEELHRRVAQYVAACAAKLRAQHFLCGEVRVFLLTNRFREDRPQRYENRLRRLSVPTGSTLLLTSYVAGLLREAFRLGVADKRAGVILSELQSKSVAQTDLFDATDRTKYDRLMQTLDALNDRFCRHCLTTAAEGFKPFRMHRDHLSPQYMTNWTALIKVQLK